MSCKKNALVFVLSLSVFVGCGKDENSGSDLQTTQESTKSTLSYSKSKVLKVRDDLNLNDCKLTALYKVKVVGVDPENSSYTIQLQRPSYADTYVNQGIMEREMDVQIAKNVIGGIKNILGGKAANAEPDNSVQKIDCEYETDMEIPAKTLENTELFNPNED